MKRNIALIISLLTLSTPAVAQEQQGCFVDWGNGAIALDSLCPMPVSETPSPAANQNALDLADAAYADAYCQAREDGIGDTSARERAADAASGFLVGVPVSLREWLEGARESAALTCPEFAAR